MKNVGKRFFLISLIIIVLDQISKNLVFMYLSSGKVVNVISDYFVLRFVRNTGAGFGILKDQNLALIMISILILIIIIYHFNDIPNLFVANFVSLIAAGAVGNLIDRIRMGFVIDFFDIGIRTLRWPTFNVADMAIVIGAAGLAYHFWKE